MQPQIKKVDFWHQKLSVPKINIFGYAAIAFVAIAIFLCFTLAINPSETIEQKQIVAQPQPNTAQEAGGNPLFNIIIPPILAAAVGFPLVLAAKMLSRNGWNS